MRSKRIDNLLGLLKARDSWTTHALAAELEVSHRTVMRDLHLLRDKGIPVEGDRGRGGGIQLYRNWGVGRLNLDYRETIDLVLSLSIMEKLRSPLLLRNLKSIRNKISISFADSQRERILSIRKRVVVGEQASEQVMEGYGKINPACLDLTQEAFFEMRRLKITYVDEKRVKTRRVIEPQFLLLNWPAWYILAWDELRDGPRFFRIDRIKSACIQDGFFRLRNEELFLKLMEGAGKSI